MADKEIVLGEIHIRLEGAADTNKITTFEFPIIRRIGDGENSRVEFETKELVKAMKKALDGLI